MPTNDKEIHYISFLRILAMFAIVGAHTIATPVIYYANEYSSFWLKLSVVLAEICRGGVNIFIAISGALFLNPEKDLVLSKLLKKYILRLLFALLLFGTVFALMEIVFTERTFYLSQIATAFINTLQNKSWGHLWYLYMLVGLYLITPVLKIFVKNASHIEVKYIIFVLFIFILIFPLIKKYSIINIGFYIPFVGTPIFFYFMGYAIHSRIVRIPNYISVILIVISLFIFIIESFIDVNVNIEGVFFVGFSRTELFKSLIPIAVFSLSFNKCKETSVRFYTLSELSFGVYLFHAVFINFIYKVLHLTPSIIPVPLIWVIVFITTSALSLITTYFLRKIPIVKKYIL